VRNELFSEGVNSVTRSLLTLENIDNKGFERWLQIPLSPLKAPLIGAFFFFDV
jgi:hypothetical protein